MITLFDPALFVAAELLDDLERTRIANENRLRQLTRPSDQLDKDGVTRGFGLTGAHDGVARAALMVAAIRDLEKVAARDLERRMKVHPLGPWVLAQPGVGLRQSARLLAAVADPYWHPVENRPRKVREFLAYCGFREDNGVARRRRLGQSINWNPAAKMRTYLIAVSCMKNVGPYRDVYDATRKRYAESTHAAVCLRCGPAGRPAQPGSALNPGHQHARALRAVSKVFLADLWHESKRLHEEATSVDGGS